LFQDITRIAAEHKDEELRGLFYRGHILHINFYEGWLSKDDVESEGKSVKLLVNKIKKLLEDGK